MLTANFTRKESIRTPKNNDPLAHVYLLEDSYDGAIAEHRMQTEFITDIGERLENQPFFSSYSYSFDDDEVVYDTGLLYMESLRQSYEAALSDVRSGSFTEYHAQRQGAFLEQGKLLKNWLDDNQNKSHLMLVSLCPDDMELPTKEAKKQSFKPDRMMASIQLHAKNSDGTVTMVAFSLDGLTLSRLQALLGELQLCDTVANTSLEQLMRPVFLQSEAGAEQAANRVIDIYDNLMHQSSQNGLFYKQGIDVHNNIVEANAFVAKHPEAYELYRTVIRQVAKSLKAGRVLPDLHATVQERLARYYSDVQLPTHLQLRNGDVFQVRDAEVLIDYLRSQAVPEYLMQKLHDQQVGASEAVFSADIGAAGMAATTAGRTYDGACPSSTNLGLQSASDEQAAELGLKLAVRYETPKPLLTKGDFDVLPIGSCPVCGSECGTGIKDKKSGRWYCTESGCSAFKKEIYDYVFGSKEQQIHRTKNMVTDADTQDSKQKVAGHDASQQLSIRNTQNEIWLLEHALYSDELTEVDKNTIKEQLIVLHQNQQMQLRLAIGNVAVPNEAA